MLGIQEKEAISEVLEILDYMDEEYKNKLPSKFLKFLQENKDNNYKKHININKNINSQITKSKTKALLGVIFYNFWCNEEERKEFEKLLKKNEIKKQEELSKNYNYEDLFKKIEKIEHVVDEKLPVIIRKTWYQKLFNTLKKFFHINK